ncbi:hypothetical protein LMG6003_02385 [Achromobacter insolitus]|nr:hypothetical protein LMG6003_02385 [Achromobacter insolitus]
MNVALRAQDDGRAGGRRAGDEEVAARLGLQDAARRAGSLESSAHSAGTNPGTRGGACGACGACDAQVLARAQLQPRAALREPRFAYGQVPCRVRAQGAVGDRLTVGVEIAPRAQVRVGRGGEDAIQNQIAPGVSAHALALQLATRVQPQVTPAFKVQGTSMG